MRDLLYYDGLMKRARNESAGKPLKNKTRLFRDGDDYVIRFHYTDIVRLCPDGTTVLANGGWNTVTTMERINSHGSRHVYSIGGDWYVRLQPDPDDPRPEKLWREIPRPFEIRDPGPEPVKNNDGCIAGQIEEYSYEDKKYDFAATDNDRRVGHRVHSYGDRFDIQVARNGRIVWVEKEPDYWVRQETADTDDLKVCPHCQRFNNLHARWSAIMNGDPWYGRSLDSKSFAKMTEMLERYGSREGWREAYLADYRQVRQRNKDLAEWEERNRVPFFDGIVVDSDGYAIRPDKKQTVKLAPTDN